jgi:hypothetical protein
MRQFSGNSELEEVTNLAVAGFHSDNMTIYFLEYEYKCKKKFHSRSLMIHISVIQYRLDCNSSILPE